MATDLDRTHYEGRQEMKYEVTRAIDLIKKDYTSKAQTVTNNAITKAIKHLEKVVKSL